MKRLRLRITQNTETVVLFLLRGNRCDDYDCDDNNDTNNDNNYDTD